MSHRAAKKAQINADWRLHEARKKARAPGARGFHRGQRETTLGAPAPAPERFTCTDCERDVWRPDTHHHGRCLRCESSRLRRVS